jgi:hypothetical protein
MEYLHTSLRFSTWALEAVVFLPPLCFAFVLAMISLVWAAIKQQPFRLRLWKTHHWFVIGHVLFFVAAIAVGVFGANPIGNPTIPHPPILAAVHCLDVVTFGSVASCGFWIWRMKGFRWYAASLLLLAEVITWGALFVAGMSVSGDWL